MGKKSIQPKQVYTLNGERYTADETGQLVPLIEVKEVSSVKLAYSPDEAMETLGLSRNLIMNLLYSGQLKGVKAGRRWLISSQAINDFLNPVN